ncbi:unnamed protein product [Allacma fusca]|uniref:Uncharacterized protein n=1 Tax=Allacma fusca TaxID=39272 RepID=A0A8J2KU31_9HEXA|nr:unnamed protein product [Allacma fusca]
MEVSKVHLLRFLLYLFFHSVTGQLKNPCNHNEFRCADESGCLSTEKLCNGIDNCQNGEDEKGNSQWDCTKSTLQTECSLQELKCRFGGCIPKSKKCDGVPDCWGGNDEATDLCSSKRPFRPRLSTLSPPTSKPQQIIEPIKKVTQNFYPVQIINPVQNYQPFPGFLEQFSSTWPPQAATTPLTTTSIQYIDDLSQPDNVPAIRVQPRKRGCPVLPKESGVEISCYMPRSGRFFDCTKIRSPIGAEITYSCAKYYASPKTGATTASITCKENNTWSTRNPRWKCNLTCGFKPVRPIPLIIQGRTAAPYDWPWHVALYNEDPPNSGTFNYYCGGTLISLRAVLTAAHCATTTGTSNKRTDRIIVIPGKYHRSFDKNDDKDRYAQRRRVVDIDVNEYYNTVNFEGDIAILWLDKEVDVTDGVRPACLPSKREDVVPGDDDFSLGILPGWGRSNNREIREELQEVDLPVVDIQTCKKSHPTFVTLVRASTFCAGYRNGTTACDGDSGGGLMFKHPQEKDKLVVKGIVSAGVQRRRGSGCEEQYYTVFTKVTHYRDWIDAMLQAKNNV